MSDVRIIGTFFSVSVLNGLFGLLLMSVVIRVASQFKPVAVGPVKAIGSIFTESMESASMFGWTIHCGASIFFGMLYTFFLMAVNPPLAVLYLPLSVMLGAAHGFLLFFLLIPTLAEHHPNQLVREQGGAISAVYILAHIAFGLGVGLMFMWLTQG